MHQPITCACLAWLLSPVAFRAFCAFQKKLKEVQLVVEFQDATFFTYDVHWHLDVPAETNLRFPNSIAKSSFWRFPLCPSPPELSSPLWVHWRWPQGMPKWVERHQKPKKHHVPFPLALSETVPFLHGSYGQQIRWLEPPGKRPMELIRWYLSLYSIIYIYIHKYAYYIYRNKIHIHTQILNTIS